MYIFEDYLESYFEIYVPYGDYSLENYGPIKFCLKSSLKTRKKKPLK